MNIVGHVLEINCGDDTKTNTSNGSQLSSVIRTNDPLICSRCHVECYS